MRMPRVMVGMVGVWLAATASASAEGRPLKQLPSDLLHWSMSWINIPQGMVEAGQAYGPVAAVTLGPVQGAASMVHSMTADLWDIMKADKASRQSARRPSSGMALVRYEF